MNIHIYPPPHLESYYNGSKGIKKKKQQYTYKEKMGEMLDHEMFEASNQIFKLYLA